MLERRCLNSMRFRKNFEARKALSKHPIMPVVIAMNTPIFTAVGSCKFFASILKIEFLFDMGVVEISY